MRANLRWLSMLLSLLLLAAVHSPAAHAQTEQTLRVDPALLLADLAPGESETVNVTVTAKEPMRIEVVPQGLGQRPDGGFQILPESEDSSIYTGRPYVKAVPRQFTLNANQSKKVKVTISVPKDAGEGGRYAILEVKGSLRKPGEEENVGVGATIGASVVVTLEGTAQTRTGDITEVKIAPVQSGNPISVVTSLRNTGNYHYGASPVRMFAGATLKDPRGNNVVTTVTSMTEMSLVPEYTRAFGIDLTTAEKLSPGRYAVDVQVGLEDGTILDRATGYLDVTQELALGEVAAPQSSGGGSGVIVYAAAGLAALAGVLGLRAFLAARRRRRALGMEGD